MMVVLPKMLKEVYFREVLERRNRKKILQSKVEAETANQLIFRLTKEEKKLPDIANPSKVEFLLRDYPATNRNNSTAQVVAVNEKTGRKMYEMLAVICALLNRGGGVLFWGVNPKTLYTEGIALREEEWEKVKNEVLRWPTFILGKIQLKVEDIRVHSSLLEGEEKE